jgi:hypothetical protein
LLDPQEGGSIGDIKSVTMANLAREFDLAYRPAIETAAPLAAGCFSLQSFWRLK